MQVPIDLRFYYQTAAVFVKMFRVPAGCIHSFRILSKETLRIMYPKNPFLKRTLK